MNHNYKQDLKNHLIKEKKEKLSEKSVEAIIKENLYIIEEKSFTLRAVISPADYPYHEQLDFNPFEFTNFFNQLLMRSYSLNKETQPIIFFDQQGSIIDYSAFLIPIIPNKWMSLRKRNRYNNILIKNDGVLLFITSQNVEIDNKYMLDLDSLSLQLEIFFSHIIPEIYENMNYEDRLKIKIECFGLRKCYIQDVDHLEKIKPLRGTSSRFSRSYILNLQNPIAIYRIIINDMRRLFEF